MDTTGVIRTILMVDAVAMALLALIYLRQRRLGFMASFGWGLLALFVPILGPFLLIARRPGEWDPNFSFAGDARRLVLWMRRLLPEPVPGKSVSKIERARQRRKLRQEKQR